MRKVACFIAFLALLTGCSGHGRTTPAPGGPAAQSGARSPRSVGGTGTTSLTFYDQYAPTSGPCNASGLTITNGSYAVQSASFAAGQGPQLMVSNCNGFTTPQYVKVTLGTPQYGYPYIRQDGYTATVDAYGPAQVTATWTALGSSLPGTPGATATVTYTIGSPVDFSLLWQTNSGTTTGAYGTDVSGCNATGTGTATRTISADNVSFAITRDTSTSYTDSGHTTPGTSACYRNQINPHDPNTNDVMLFTMGQHYSFFFQTVVRLNGNTYYGTNSDGNFAVDIPAIVWQTHSYGQNPGTGPCDMLIIGNTRKALNAGYGGYQNVSAHGDPTWTFRTCTDSSDYTGNAYNSPDTLYDGEVDNWQIEIDAQYDTHGGHVTAYRNGTSIYDATAGICDSTAVGCWWNFGPYMFYWQTTEEPPGYNSAGVSVNVNGMTLTTPSGGGGGLSRKRRV